MRRRSRGGSDSTLCPCSSRVHVPVVFEGTRFEYRLAVVSTTNSCASYIVMTMARVISTLAILLKAVFGIFRFYAETRGCTKFMSLKWQELKDSGIYKYKV